MKSKLHLIALALLVSALAPPAWAELVIVVNPKNPATRMFPSQAAQFFLGGSVLFSPVEQLEGSPVRLEFYKKVLEKEPAQVQAIWSKIVFTGKGKPPKECKSSADVKKLISENLNAIGYLEKADVDDSVKVIATIP